jgi:predicted nuclease of predicted toxin-antitoxin system
VRFLIDADLPRSTKALLEQHGHEGIDVRDIGLRSAKDPLIAQYALQHGLCLLTGDFGFADVLSWSTMLSWSDHDN